MSSHPLGWKDLINLYPQNFSLHAPSRCYLAECKACFYWKDVRVQSDFDSVLKHIRLNHKDLTNNKEVRKFMLLNEGRQEEDQLSFSALALRTVHILFLFSLTSFVSVLTSFHFRYASKHWGKHSLAFFQTQRSPTLLPSTSFRLLSLTIRAFAIRF